MLFLSTLIKKLNYCREKVFFKVGVEEMIIKKILTILAFRLYSEEELPAEFKLYLPVQQKGRLPPSEQGQQQQN